LFADDTRKRDKSQKSPSVSEISIQNSKARLHPSYHHYHRHHNQHHLTHNGTALAKTALTTNMLKTGLYSKVSGIA
jgi:hypothetical protein